MKLGKSEKTFDYAAFTQSRQDWCGKATVRLSAKTGL